MPIYSGDNKTYWNLNLNGDQSINPAPASLVGTWIANRTTSNVVNLYQNDVSVASSGAATSALSNSTFKIAGLNADNTSTATFKRAFIGGALTAGDRSAIEAAVAGSHGSTYAWGDSLTLGNEDGTGVTFPNVLAALLGNPVVNNGVGGETSTQILTRFNALPAAFGNPVILEMGRNNFSSPVTVKANIASAVAALTTTHYLIHSVLPSADDSAGSVTNIATLNSDLATVYGTRFVDMLAPLQAASNGSAGDLADVAAGIVPRSLRFDAVHLNAAGYTIVANALYAKRALLGF
jgi:lysophospholipase L1-like esterase